MKSVLAVLCIWLVHTWMPVTAHKRLSAVTGRGDVPTLEARLLLWQRRRRAKDRGQVETTRLLQMLVGELTAGIPTPQAFTGVLGPSVSAPSALRESPPTADDHIWRDVASVWDASDRAGLSMAIGIQRIHGYALIDQEVAREVRANAAAPRFAMLTLVLLPVVAWATATGTGARPLAFLLQTYAGWACVCIGGMLFALAGLWMRALTRAALA